MPRVGVVLSGGIAKGAYQIGVLKALLENIEPNNIKVFSGASVGALIGYAAAAGKLQEIEARFKSIDLYGPRQFVKKIVRPRIVEEYISGAADEQLPEDVKVYCTCCEMPFADIRYVDLSQYNKKYREAYLCAAISLAPIYKPVNIEGRSFVDGIYKDNLPIAPCRREKLDYIFAVHFDTAGRFMNLYSEEVPVIQFVFPDGAIGDSFDLRSESVADMIERGYETADKSLRLIMKRGQDDVEYIKKVNSSILRKKQQFRVNIDTMVNMFNKMSGAVRRKKIKYFDGRISE